MGHNNVLHPTQGQKKKKIIVAKFSVVKLDTGKM